MLAYISHPDCLLHEMGAYHPEQPARLAAINDRLIACGLDPVLQRHDAPLVERSALLGAHDAAYLESIFAAAPAQGLVQIDADTAMNSYSLTAAQRAAGAAVLGVDLVMQGKASKAFCAVRPPGHHAESNRAMGFCFFNNIAVAAAHALEHYHLQRVAILDFDVHHGNGTEEIVSGDPRILFCSSFQHPFYPHSGDGRSAANVVNTPLPSGTDGAAFREAVESDWMPRLETFAPELILISAGFDGHLADDMAGFRLVETDYAWVTRKIVAQAQRSAAGRIVSSLEGGYDLQSLALSVEAHLKELAAG